MQNLKNRVKEEIKHLQNIIMKSEENDCDHEKGELYALVWVLRKLEDIK